MNVTNISQNFCAIEQLRFFVLSDSRLKSERAEHRQQHLRFLDSFRARDDQDADEDEVSSASINLSGVTWQFFSLDPRTALRDVALRLPLHHVYEGYHLAGIAHP
ncbi:hypothetical protein K0M31_007183 [Melipona bicolor]|uniref:Uncharacterized protein n=1 Tax=Melipona bicolor TaxID=60889 RepID=A0AA40FRX0_9HYME|nr:hypothetical protein K0M31_007183 [Melipona bicolor]